MKIKQIPEDFIVEEIPVKIRKADYTVFWMEKTNLDLNHVLKILAKKLKTPIKYFGFAGTKDKKAVTNQRISVYDPGDESYKKLSELRLRNIKIRKISKGSKIKVGDLKGNKFTITIRDIKLSQKETIKRLEKAFIDISKGIPNYFGVQRFGEVRPISHIIGKYILKNEFECAVKTYLCKTFEAEPEDSKKARNFLSKNWNREGFEKASDIFPERLVYERSLLEYLTGKNNFKSALSIFPRNLLIMFIHAYQSYVWNNVAEYCVENKLKHRNIPLVGYNTRLGRKKIDKKIKNIIDNDNIELKMFAKNRIYGSERSFILKPKHMEIIRTFKDKYNKNRNASEIKFTLKKGSYATIVLEKVEKCLQ